jgi:hypothetical protein
MWEDLLGVLRTRRSATPSDHLLAEAWQDRLPDELMSLWREVGLGPLEDGLLTVSVRRRPSGQDGIGLVPLRHDYYRSIGQ